jgi:hypothetical protein
MTLNPCRSLANDGIVAPPLGTSPHRLAPTPFELWNELHPRGRKQKGLNFMYRALLRRMGISSRLVGEGEFTMKSTKGTSVQVCGLSELGRVGQGLRRLKG